MHLFFFPNTLPEDDVHFVVAQTWFIEWHKIGTESSTITRQSALSIFALRTHLLELQASQHCLGLAQFLVKLATLGECKDSTHTHLFFMNSNESLWKSLSSPTNLHLALRKYYRCSICNYSKKRYLSNTTPPHKHHKFFEALSGTLISIDQPMHYMVRKSKALAHNKSNNNVVKVYLYRIKI